MNLRQLLSLLNMPHLRTVAALSGDLQSYLRLNFLYAAHELGLLTALRIPSTQHDLQDRLCVQNTPLFDSLLRMGVALGELADDDGAYRLKGHRARALAAPDGDALAAFLQEHVSYHGSVYRHLAGRVRGEPPGDYLADMGELVARSSRIMEPFVGDYVHRTVMALHPERMLEIGCGSGIYLRYAAEAYTDATGIGLELQPQVAEQARKNLAEWGVSERFRITTGDIRNPPSELDGPFDLITLYNNIYYFRPEERSRLFANLFARLKQGAPLALVSAMEGKDFESVNFDIVLQSTQGCTRLPSTDELVDQLRASGFRRIKTESLSPVAPLNAVLAFK